MKKDTSKWTIDEIVADLIQIKMGDQGKTNKELASLLNVSESFISQVLNINRRQHFSISQVYIISEWLKVPIHYLIPDKYTQDIYADQKDISLEDSSKLFETIRKNTEEKVFKGENLDEKY